MGTFLTIKVQSDDRGFGKHSDIVDEAFELARSLSAILNVYDPGSELNRLNIEKNMVVSKDLEDVLLCALNLGQSTGGALDITVAPLMKKVGFYDDMPGELYERIPDKTDGIGLEYVNILHGRKIELADRHTWLDLSAVAKGYIVDRLAGFLEANGIRNYLVNAGGEIYCAEKKGPGKWKIGIRDPRSRSVLGILYLEGSAVATSGDYENFIVMKDGAVSSHIIDPNERKVRKRRYSSVTVISSRCAVADGLSTAFMVLGPERATSMQDVVKNNGIIFVTEGVNGPELRFAGEARKYLKEERK
jgi:thiamine biosynthesis lipoprotein